MSKFTKLLSNPSLFFKDAVRKRLQSQPQPLAKRSASVAEAQEADLDRIPTYVFGFSTWKQFMRTWFPDRELFFLPKTIDFQEFDKNWKNRIVKDKRSEIFIWGMKVERYVLRFAKENGVRCAHVEDGFIRSIGLGATKTPPFSLTLDYQAPYFDATRPTDLENLLSTYDFDADPALLERARTLMQMLLQTGISKYNNANPVDIERLYGPKTAKRVLVVGQVESDASIEYGSNRPYTNNDLVMVAALENPGAQIIYKPHPDVLNKHREMVSDPADVSHLCMVLKQDVPLAQAFETVDRVYTITSQAGFEALMRGIPVTTLGCPFYSGWGLTDDRQANDRRTRKLSLEQVFAAAYLLYPKYFDPVYKMPISAEEAVDRLNSLKQLASPSVNAVGATAKLPQEVTFESVQALENQESVTKVDEAAPGPLPTYVIGMGAWKSFFTSCFPDREFAFLSAAITADEFSKKWKSRLLKNPNSEILVQGNDIPPFIARFADANGFKRYSMVDGFIRSIELDPSKAPPLSLLFDAQAPYFNATRSSDLETLLLTYDFDANPELLKRADSLIRTLLENGLSKFNDTAPVEDLEAVYGPKTDKRVLVLGQDESAPVVKYGSTRTYSNNDLVMIAAMENPGAQIIFKPHPAVLNKRPRATSSNLRQVQHVCMVLKQDLPLAQALETVDHVYTITSQAGFEALMRGIPVTTLGCPFYAGWGLTDDRQENLRRTRKLTVQQVFAAAYLLYPKYFDPVYKKQVTMEQAVERLLNMKHLAEVAKAPVPVIEMVEAAPASIPTYLFGFNQWKQFLTAWFPEREMHFLPIALKPEDFTKKWAPRILKDPRSEFFIWGFKVPPFVTRFAEKHGIKRYFMEDGFIRSIALGASHTPPFSLSLDSQTPYFDATKPSDLEHLLNTYDFDADTALMERAERLMQTLLQTGLSKYNHAKPVDVEAIYGPKTTKRILVVGQVEEDASIKYGCARAYTNNDAVMIAAMENPGAQIIYKPHPDVLNKHRGMLSDPAQVKHLCMVIEQDMPLAQAFETVDHVYTITSQAGLEALMRGISVTTLGCPFYAGWGLTDERQPNPRRQRRLTVQQVFAAAYLLYPKYFDPVYKQPISSEQAVERLLALRELARSAQKPVDEEPVETQVEAADQALSTRVPTYMFGFNQWKPFLASWLPERELHFLPSAIKPEEFERKWETQILSDSRSEFFIRGLKIPAFILRKTEQHGISRRFIEDGFIRPMASNTAGTPPFSLVQDSQAAYFDANKSSDLEVLLNTHDFEADTALMERAERLMQVLLHNDLGSDGPATQTDIEAVYGVKTAKRILVLGQAEDDVSLQYGCPRPYTNKDAVMMAALENPGAQIIFRPQFDTPEKREAMLLGLQGVRHLCLVPELDISLFQAFETVDHVYTITAQAGFDALMRGVAVTTLGCPFYAGWGLTDDRQPNLRRTRQLTLLQVFAGAYILYSTYFDPVYKTAIAAEQAVDRLLSMKSLMSTAPATEGLLAVADPDDAENQATAEENLIAQELPPIPTYVFGFTPWKAYMKGWFPERELHFLPKTISPEEFKKTWSKRILRDARSEIFIWGFKVEAFITRFIAQHSIKCNYVEDGFIRSIGLGASRTPPFSLTLDTKTPYFDARIASDLEDTLNTYDFDADPELIARAEKLMQLLLQSGLSKYNHASKVDIETIYGPKTVKRILVVGQVEDDASIKFGSFRPYNNNDAVMIAAMENPGAQIIYKPHPDVLNKHRAMASNPDNVRHLCQVLEQDVPLAQAFETVDHVYTITSQAGFEALMRGISVTTLGCPFYSGWGLTDDRQPNARRIRKLTLLQVFAAAYLLYPKYFDPVYKMPLTPEQAVDRLLGMKALADAAKPANGIPDAGESAGETGDGIEVLPAPIPTYVFGFSPWKQFLKTWFPERKLNFVPKTLTRQEFDQVWKKKILADANAEIFMWGLKVDSFVHRFVEQHGLRRFFIEDGFIRSIGLGATKAPPFSLTLDTKTPYFDASKPSDLEELLDQYDFNADPQLLIRAETMMRTLVETGLSKYNHAVPVDIETIYGPKTAKRILVVGQVEDDASIEYGSARPYSNNDAVMIAVLENPDAQIIYKPHPDVLNQHRKMSSNPDDVRHLCLVLDQQDVPLAQAFETIDHVYTITSQAGFEALMRGIPVTTLGCPFYAGWGLTNDRQPNPRRTRKLRLVEVFAAAYLLYPKYFDPVYKMPISSEQAVERLLSLRSMARLVPPAPVEQETEVETVDTAAEDSTPTAQDILETAAIKEELGSLRLELAGLRLELRQHAATQLASDIQTRLGKIDGSLAKLPEDVGTM